MLLAFQNPKKRQIRVTKTLALETGVLALTKEYELPSNGTLRYDSSYYYRGGFLYYFSFQWPLKEGCLDLIEQEKFATKLDIGSWGDPARAKFDDMGSTDETSLNEMLIVVETAAPSDYTESTLVGVTIDSMRFIHQDVGLDLYSAVQEGTVLIFSRDMSEPLYMGVHVRIDSIRLDLMTGKSDEFNLVDSSIVHTPKR